MENTAPNSNTNIDTGLACLVMIAQFHGVAADAEQIRHSFAVGEGGMAGIDILRAAKELGFKAKEAVVEYERLQKLSLPAIAEISCQTSAISSQEKKNGTSNQPSAVSKKEYLIIAKAEEDNLLVLH